MLCQVFHQAKDLHIILFKLFVLDMKKNLDATFPVSVVGFLPESMQLPSVTSLSDTEWWPETADRAVKM